MITSPKNLADCGRVSLKQNLINGGIDPEHLEVPCKFKSVPSYTDRSQILIRGGPSSLAQADTYSEDGQQTGNGVDVFTRPLKTQVRMPRPTGESWAESGPEWPHKTLGNGYGGHNKGKAPSNGRHNSSGAQEDDISWDPDLDKDDGNLGMSRNERKRYAREEKRTILVKNLSDRTTHLDIVQIARGGLVLDIYLRSNERNASISFVEGISAQKFMNYIKRNDVYIHGKRVCTTLHPSMQAICMSCL